MCLSTFSYWIDSLTWAGDALSERSWLIPHWSWKWDWWLLWDSIEHRKCSLTLNQDYLSIGMQKGLRAIQTLPKVSMNPLPGKHKIRWVSAAPQLLWYHWDTHNWTLPLRGNGPDQVPNDGSWLDWKILDLLLERVAPNIPSQYEMQWRKKTTRKSSEKALLSVTVHQQLVGQFPLSTHIYLPE